MEKRIHLRLCVCAWLFVGIVSAAAAAATTAATVAMREHSVRYLSFEQAVAAIFISHNIVSTVEYLSSTDFDSVVFCFLSYSLVLLLSSFRTFTLHSLSRYGSPHHCRSQSVKAPGRASGRPNQLSLPQQRSRYMDPFYIFLQQINCEIISNLIIGLRILVKHTNSLCSLSPDIIGAANALMLPHMF